MVTRNEAERRGATANPAAYGYLDGPSAIQIFGFDRDRVLALEDGERVVGDVGPLARLKTRRLTRAATDG